MGKNEESHSQKQKFQLLLESLCVCGKGCWDGTQGSVCAKQEFYTEVHPQPLAF